MNYLLLMVNAVFFCIMNNIIYEGFGLSIYVIMDTSISKY